MAKRITPKQVAEAFTTYDIKPTRGTYGYDDPDGAFCGCALTAYAALLGYDVRHDYAGAKIYGAGLDIDWLDGVISAFDYESVPEDYLGRSKNHPFWRGYRFGKEVARLVFGDEAEEAGNEN